MDIQSRTAEYGLGRHHAHAEIEARCLTPLLTDAKDGGITLLVLESWHFLSLELDQFFHAGHADHRGRSGSLSGARPDHGIERHASLLPDTDHRARRTARGHRRFHF